MYAAMKSFLQLIDDLGPARLASELGVDTSAISHVRARKSISSSLLARAMGRYGSTLDLTATLRELKPADYQLGRHRAHAQQGEGGHV